MTLPRAKYEGVNGVIDMGLLNVIRKLRLRQGLPMPEAEAQRVLGTAAPCTFNRSPESDPILWASEGGAAAMKLNGVLVGLEAQGDPQEGAATFSAPGTTVAVRLLGDEVDWRQNAELVFELDQGLSVGYRGFYGCEAG
ncbi:hypothetical protein [Plastorhodobacter daqingensis]